MGGIGECRAKDKHRRPSPAFRPLAHLHPQIGSVTSVPMLDLRNSAHSAFDAAIAAADPEAAVLRHAGTLNPAPGGRGSLIVVALGKAAPAMMRAARAALRPDATLIVTAPGTQTEADDGPVLFGSHPVPDEQSLAAGTAILDLVADLGPDDRVIALISGGGSSLAVAPTKGVSLADKAALNEALLASGLDIVAMNLIRQQVSRLKGGGLLAAAAPAMVSALILSDVIGDDIRAVASGPTAPPVGTAAQARQTAENAGIWDKLPHSVKDAILNAQPPQSGPPAENVLVGSNTQSVAAAHEAVEALQVTRIDTPLVGDVVPACEWLIDRAKWGSFVAGGETTVQLRGTGQGGRNQDLALRFALAAETADLPTRWVFLSGGTDGRDGPTDAGGALVDQDTVAKIRAAGIDPVAHLANNDAYPALDAAGALLKMSPTGTNVADIQIFLCVNP